MLLIPFLIQNLCENRILFSTVYRIRQDPYNRPKPIFILAVKIVKSCSTKFTKSICPSTIARNNKSCWHIFYIIFMYTSSINYKLCFNNTFLERIIVARLYTCDSPCSIYCNNMKNALFKAPTIYRWIESLFINLIFIKLHCYLRAHVFPHLKWHRLSLNHFSVHKHAIMRRSRCSKRVTCSLQSHNDFVAEIRSVGF